MIYEARLVPLVASLLARLLAPGGVGLIASPYRVAAEGIPGRARRGRARVPGRGRDRPIRRRRLIEGTIYRVTRYGRAVSRDSTGACR